MQKKLEEYDDIKDLAEDIQKSLDAIATDLQNRIHVLYNRLHNMNYLPKEHYEYALTHTQYRYEIEGLEDALERLNKHFKNFRTNYEYIDGYIAENNTKPVRIDQREEE